MPTATHDHPEPVTPTAREADLAREAGVRLASVLESAGPFEVSVSAESGRRESILVPASSLRLLADALARMGAGDAVALLPVETELSAEEAADVLNVSPPYLNKLLDERALPSREVDARRKVRLRDLLAYKRRVEEERSKALDELAAQAQELGMGY